MFFGSLKKIHFTVSLDHPVHAKSQVEKAMNQIDFQSVLRKSKSQAVLGHVDQCHSGPSKPHLREKNNKLQAKGG